MGYVEELSDWKDTIIDMNTSYQDLDSKRDDCYRWLANIIKKGFDDNGLPVPTVHFKSDASQIICTWVCTDLDKDIIVPYSLINDLHMDFVFTRVVNKDGFWEKRLVFYPFNERG